MVKPAGNPASWQQAPSAVKRAVGLLCLQATIWATLSGAIASGAAKAAIAHPSKGTAAAVLALLAVAAGTFAIGKFWLAYRLPRGTHRTREAVISVEGLMGCFAGLILLYLMVTLYGLVLSPPVIIGGIMSVRVAHGLTKPPARQYFDAHGAAGAEAPDPPSADGGRPAQFRARLAAA